MIVMTCTRHAHVGGMAKVCVDAGVVKFQAGRHHPPNTAYERLRMGPGEIGTQNFGLVI